MRFRAVVGCGFLISTLLWGEKPRDWKDGTVVESGSERRSEITGATTTGQVDANGNISSNTSTNTRRFDDYSYVIDTQDRVYVISETVARIGGVLGSVPLRKAAHLVPGTAIKFAFDRDQMFIQNETGHERKFHIDRVSIKTPTKTGVAAPTTP